MGHSREEQGMTTDRELLEMAAKACGITWFDHDGVPVTKDFERWNPLTDRCLRFQGGREMSDHTITLDAEEYLAQLRELKALRARVAELEKEVSVTTMLLDSSIAREKEWGRDAARYRRLRDEYSDHFAVTRFCGGATIPRFRGDDLDEVLDRAMKK
jgi:hypothetical protein